MQTYSKLLNQGQKISKLKLGNKSINLAYLGNINIKTAYLGSQLVIGDNKQYYNIKVDLRNIDYNLDKYREMRIYHENTEAIPFYFGDRFSIVNDTVYLYTYGLGSYNYILDAASYDYIKHNNTDTNGINISKNLYGYNYNCYYNKHGIWLNNKYHQNLLQYINCYGGNAIGFTITCNYLIPKEIDTTLIYQELPIDSPKIRLSYTASTEYSITKMSDLNQSFVKFSYEYNSEYDYMDMKPNEEKIPSNVSSKLLSYVLEVDVDREFAEGARAGESKFMRNTFDIIWEIDNATFTLPIYHVHTASKPNPDVTPIFYIIKVHYVFTRYPNYLTEFYVHLYYNGEQINNSNELLQCSLNDNNEYGDYQSINISKNLWNTLHSGSAKNVFRATFKMSNGNTIPGRIIRNEMTSDGYIIEFLGNFEVVPVPPDVDFIPIERNKI